MAKHTPGPWQWSPYYRTEDGRETWTLLGENGYGILACDGEGNSPQGIGDEANACLIAAAPDLLRELSHLRSCLNPWLEAGYGVPGIATLNGADAAIAKATGAAP